MTRVAVTDYTFATLDVETEILRPLGCEIVAHKRTNSAAELSQLVQDADHVITQFAPLTAEVIAAMRKARVIVRYGVGVDNVDLVAAPSHGIPVCNVPDYCMNEVADHTLALILGLSRQVVPNCLGVRNGKWGLSVPLSAMQALCDLTAGVVGFGRIGREVVRRLLAFKCRVLVHDPVVSPEMIQAGGEAVSFDKLLRTCDVITLHCPATPQTRHLMNRDAFARLKPGALLINVGRGELVETAALVDALRQGHLAGAGLDVFETEPLPPDSPLLKMENVIVSSHVASASVKAVRTLRETVAGIVAKSIRGEALPNVVNGVVGEPRHGK